MPPAYFFVAIVLMAVLHFLFPLRQLVSFPWRMVGLAPLAAGVALNLWADCTFKRLGTTVKPFEESKILTTEGAFRISRNPMYLGMVFILAGIAFLMGSATPWIIVPLLAVLLDRRFIMPEQRMLEEKFGDEYRDYRRRVRRWI